MSRSRTSQSLSLHDLLDELLSDHIEKEESHRQEERRRFGAHEKYLEDRVQALASQLQEVVVDEQGNKELKGTSDSMIRRMAYRDRDEWAKENCGDEGPEPAWGQTPWEYAVPILVTDHAFKSADPRTEVDVQYGRLHWFLRLRRLVQQGEPEPEEHESLDDLADIAAELDRLNTPEVVDGLSLTLWTRFPQDCEGMGLPKPGPAVEPSDAAGDKMFLLSEAKRIFGFRTVKTLDCFLENHPEVKQSRPLTKAGTPHKRQRTVSVVGLSRAISQDDKILSDPVRKQRIKARLHKAKLYKQLEEVTLAYITGKKR